MTDTAPRLSVERTDTGLQLKGEIDAHSAPMLADALREQATQTKRVELDMSEVAFIDSSGLRVIVECLNHARANDGAVVIHRASHAVTRLLELSGLDGLLAPADEGSASA
jgi:anti-anti-sigma factor